MGKKYVSDTPVGEALRPSSLFFHMGREFNAWEKYVFDTPVGEAL